MLPMPTRHAIATFVGCALLLGLAIVGSSAAAATLASVGFAGLSAALAATMPLGRRVRRQRLEFAWWLGHGEPSQGGGAVTPGAPFEVRCFIRHRGGHAMLLSALDPIVPGGPRVADTEPRALWLAPRARTEFSFKLVAPAAGRVVLHGLAVTLRGPFGLFEVPLYFPNPLVIKVLPRSAARVRTGARVVTGLPVERAGRTILRRHGGGTELREIREFQSGDPFKSIAWKASARSGRLLVREVEREVQETRYVVLDVSGTMRGGPPGSRKLDFAIEAASAEARRTLDEGDRMGIITVDGRILAHVPPGEGAPQMIRIYDALLAATEVVDQDLTDIEEDELVSLVARYVRHQDGIDFAAKDKPGGWDVVALGQHVLRSLASERKRTDIVAASAGSSVLRAFCRARGLPLPYRPDPRDGAKAPGLAAALREAGGKTRTPVTITVVTDLDGVGEPESLIAAVRLVRSRAHALSFVVFDARTFAPDATSALERDLSVVYGRGEQRRVRDARSMLGRLGVPVIVATAKDAPALVLARAGGARRVA